MDFLAKQAANYKGYEQLQHSFGALLVPPYTCNGKFKAGVGPAAAATCNTNHYQAPQRSLG
jgi:hypothetical protein